ncbi:NADH dehydrogenase [ubiquinone] 1 beta subcomplex subunit 2, mitochondrial [Aplysia californica]|uniref:NADH dehydrogenase [ubiquinone] 1 beta subcomplex subunit 2, mitochondrial n=1 Tax=Aplysia californica TaxID=6500 RepID=A0ABM0JNB3_APLCA|nr:NADH dehydrogenase [ubiquinone] 1 beta subcomplex subunit 2, mitochondrial [Aplysia californica]
MSVVLGKLRPLAALLRNRGQLPVLSSTRRNAATLYRAHLVKDPPAIHYVGEAMSFFLWYWILYHCYFEFDHLVPDHVYPDPSKFTDEELGIPPDDEE